MFTFPASITNIIIDIFLTWYHNRPKPRKAEGSLRNGIEVENAVTKNQKAELLKRYGVTGVCIFTGGAYSVDLTLINDLTIDVMHVALN